MSCPFQPNGLILFDDDSISDCGRDRSNRDSLGMGYAKMLAENWERSMQNSICGSGILESAEIALAIC